MFSDQAWWEELVRIGFFSLLLTSLGLLFGNLHLYLLSGVAAYLIWHLYQVYRLSRWLESDKRSSPPYAVGIWRHINTSLSIIRSQGRGRKRKLNKMLNSFLESTGALPDAIVILNSDGRVEWWNGIAAEVFGLQRTHRGVPLDTVVTDPVLNNYLQVEDFRRPLHMPAPVDETVGLEVRVVPYGKGKLLMQARDITRLQQLEVVRRDFVANVSHEIRTPLTVVKGYLETLRDRDDEAPAGWDGILEQMQQQTQRIERIVVDLLLISRLETGDAQDGQGIVGVAELLQGIVCQARELSGDLRHKIQLDADNRLCLIGHSQELESAFSNLVFNAVRYTPEGGEINIRWGLSGAGPCLAVVDTGVGIEHSHIPRLTERFYRIDVGRSREKGGTGLGLAIVKHVLGRHDAHLVIESTPNKGSTFTCCFPHSRAAS